MAQILLIYFIYLLTAKESIMADRDLVVTRITCILVTVLSFFTFKKKKCESRSQIISFWDSVGLWRAKQQGLCESSMEAGLQKIIQVPRASSSLSTRVAMEVCLNKHC